MIPALLAQLGIPLLVHILSSALGKIDNPVAKGASDALSQMEGALSTGQISPGQIDEANRHIERMTELDTQENAAVLAQVNESLRAEVASEDPYVRRMRPTFGYLMALTWAAQMFGIAYVIVFRTNEVGAVMQAIGNLSVIWTVGLSVLGIYVYKRSEDKKIGVN